MLKKVNWVFLVITLSVCANHLFGTGYFVHRSISYKLKSARREVDFSDKQNTLKDALKTLDRYEAQVSKLSFIYRSPRLDGVHRIREHFQWWLNPALDTGSREPGDTGSEAMNSLFDSWTLNYPKEMPALGVMTESQAKNSAIACYILLPISGILLLLVFLGPRLE